MTPTQRKVCRGHRGTLDAILDGREALDAHRSLSHHARSCDACARSLRTSLALRRALDAAATAESASLDDEAFAAGVLARIDAEAATPRPMARSRFAPVAAASLAAAAAILAIVALQLRGDTRNEERQSLARADDDRNPATHERARIVDAKGPAVVAGGPDVAGAEASIAIEIDRRPLDLARFAEVLRETADELEFAPDGIASAAELTARVRARVDGDARRAVRRLLREQPSNGSAGIAARVLGVSADLGDRSLLAELIPSLGAPAALGLAERGRSGVLELWRIAQEGDSATSVRVAADSLLALAEAGDPDRDPLRWIEASQAEALGIALVSASPLHGAHELLARYIDDESRRSAPWFEAWAAHPNARASLVDALAGADRGHRSNRRDHSRLLRAVGALGCPEALPFTLDALEHGQAAAANALASIDDPDALRALFGMTARGRLAPELEEFAWSEMVRLRAPAAVQVALERHDLSEARVEDLIDVLVRTGAVDPDRDLGLALARQRVLVDLAANDSLPPRLRVRALLFLADRRARKPDGLPDVDERIAALRLADHPGLAAAAWLIAPSPDEVAAAPPDVRSALDRPGSLAVRHARLSRAIEHRSERASHASL